MHKNKEGDLYGKITVYGKTFEIYYGYYEEFERNSIYNDPVPIYPDLKKNPEYTDDGLLIVTEMQAACEYYKGNEQEDSCGRCAYFKNSENLFGCCLAEQRRNRK